MADLPGDPSCSTVRTQLWVLESKRHVRHEEQGLRYVNMPALARRVARKSALRHLVDTFFEGSTEMVVGALLGGDGARLPDDELERIAELVAKAPGGGSENGAFRQPTPLTPSLIVPIVLFTVPLPCSCWRSAQCANAASAQSAEPA
jgi:predicted transcriptional regulator